MQPDQKDISLLLRQWDGRGGFASRRTADAGELDVSVRGFGTLRWPVSEADARRLCRIAQPARYGYKTETRLDRRIRDTWEIKADKLSIGPTTWPKTLERHLARMRGDLGLPGTCRLKAQLHNLLIYTPGQFFAAHQDSVKNKGMIGTLVVILPSRFTGGELVVEHRGASLRTGGSGRELTLVAFYADCRHELKPVKSGHRLALSYNLLVEGDTTAGNLEAERLDALTDAVRNHFDRPPGRIESTTREAPMKLVYLLDHEYTSRDLSWKRLKNGDSRRAAALRQVAQRLDCEILLTLAEVHETWDCEEEESGYGRYWESGEDEDESEKDGQSDLNLIALIDDSVELRHGIDSEGRKVEGSGTVAANELFWTTPSSDFEPFRTEHEGYMGNSGNTADRWYHRAALVLWPKAWAFAIRARYSPRWAIRRITATSKGGRAGNGSDLMEQLLPVWEGAARKDQTPALLVLTLGAARIASPQAALSLLAPFSLEQLSAGNIRHFVKTVQVFGVDWGRRVLRNWISENRFRAFSDTWVAEQLPILCRTLGTDGGADGNILALEMLGPAWKHISDAMRALREQGPKSLQRAFKVAIPPILALLRCGRLAECPEFQQRIVDFLSNPETNIPEARLVELLQAAHKGGRNSLRDLGLRPLQVICLARLEEQLETPLRAKGDWSIPTPLSCSCALCVKLGRFLKSAREYRLEWPLAKPNRQHVHQQIDRRELPVLHTTRRTGSPFTLILEKTKDVFAQEEKARSVRKKQLAWLKARN